MRFSTSNIDKVAPASFALFFAGLLLTWELVIRSTYNPRAEVYYEAPAAGHAAKPDGSLTAPDRRWVIVGNCLVLQGITPAGLLEEFGKRDPRSSLPSILNVGRHEHPPHAFLQYMKDHGFFPEVILANVSSWIDSDNYHHQTRLIEEQDVLGLRPDKEAAGEVPSEAPTPASGRSVRSRVEQELTSRLNDALRLTEKRYHLADFTLFAWTLVRTGNLKTALYDINLQTWFKLAGVHRDGYGYQGFAVKYEPRWDEAVNLMAAKQLRRMSFGVFLSPRYWRELEELLDHFRRGGTKILLLRMPEHPDIYEFNEQRYQVSANMNRIAATVDAGVLDLNVPRFISGVKLYDVVHPDKTGAETLTHRLAQWMLENSRDWVYADRNGRP
ncbi:MAG: hypothetical protein V2B18_03550 [Pseudomonadota bacterium]